MTERYVFVYGTLLKGQRNHHLLGQARCVAEQAWTNGKLYATTSDYPVLLVDLNGMVYGELYEIDNETLERLDELEGYQSDRTDNLYERKEQQVITDQGKLTAIVYCIGKQTADMKRDCIKSGNWLVHRYLRREQLYYFAYGSCMDNARFNLQHVDQHFQKVVGNSILDGYSLRYTISREDGGRADVVEEGGSVEGKLYEVGIDAVDYLYEREGVYAGSYRPAIVQLKLEDCSNVSALTFIVVSKEAETAPPAHYLAEILRGGKGCCSDSYIQMLEDQYKHLNKK